MTSATTLSPFKTLAWVSVVAVCALIMSAPLATFAQGTTTTPTPATATTPTPPAKDANVCDGWSTLTPSCLWYTMLNGIGAAFLTFGATMLIIFGGMFDILIQHIIIDFKGTLTTLGMLGAIDIGWSIFRDLTNLGIIGLFVFIAINIILGVEKFGQKKLIANVLIIAVLLNFSLLFTKLIIDGSNFTAYQIYKQMSQQNGGENQAPDIASGFLKPMGITAAWNTYDLVEEFGMTTNSATQALMFGIVGGFVLLLVAFVLGYGCYIIAARGILLVFLMLTASLAFLTFLIPSLQSSEYGWDKWWKTLLNTAIFAPLLMVFLFISLLIMTQAGDVTKNSITNLGSTIANPATLRTTADGWQVIFVYLMGVGLLFVSLKVSSKLAGTIGGFNFAGGAMSNLIKWPAAGMLMGGTAVASRFAVSRIGGPAAHQALDHGAEVEMLRRRLGTASPSARAPLIDKITDLEKKKAAAEKKATSDFNFLNTKLGSAIGKAVGVEAGKAKGGYIGPRKEAAESAAKDAKGIADTRNAAASSLRESEKASQEGRKAAEALKSAGEELISSARAAAETEKRDSGHNEKLIQAIKEQQEGSAQMVAIEKEHAAGKLSPQQRDAQIATQDERIRTARGNATASRDALKNIDAKHLDKEHLREAREQVKMASDTLKRLDAEIERKVNEKISDRVESGVQSAVEYASKKSKADPYQERIIEANVRKQVKGARISEKLQKFVDEEEKE